MLSNSAAGLLVRGLKGVEGGAVRFAAGLFLFEELSEFASIKGLWGVLLANLSIVQKKKTCKRKAYHSLQQALSIL